MGEKATMPAYLDQAISRRTVLTSLIGAGSLPLLANASLAEEFDNPPVFATARYQFTMIEPAMQMPAVTLMDGAGRPTRLAAMPGKILLLNFWAIWCEACQWDLPLLERFHDTIGERVRVAAVSTDTAEQRGNIKPYLNRLSIRSLPIYLDPEGRLASSETNTSAPFSLSRGMPATYLITPSGRVAGYILGVADWLTDDAKKLLKYYANA
jgi:thiol-disulfide isomerase/thioredoxin